MNKLNDLIIEAIEERHGKDIQVIDLKGMTIIADSFIIASAGNERQARAIVDNIDEKLSKNNIEPLGLEGENTSRWILMDYGDTIVHIFIESERAFYNLERLWAENDNITQIADEV